MLLLRDEKGDAMLSNDPIEAFAIRQLSTGYFMPAHFGTRSHRYSSDNPTPGCIPRIFPSRASAQVALSDWLRGEWKLEVSRYGRDDCEQDLVVIPVEGRNKEDMEVVPLLITPA